MYLLTPVKKPPYPYNSEHDFVTIGQHFFNIFLLYSCLRLPFNTITTTTTQL